MTASRHEFYQQFFELIESGQSFVCVTLVATSGSAPQDQGAKMLVTADGLYAGTVGGGKIEQKSLAESLQMLEKRQETHLYCEWNLTHDVGMTCGGNVKLYFELMNTQRWQITVFGAGHVAQSLVPLLTTLDCHVTCVDSRQEWLDKLPEKLNLQKICVNDLPAYAESLSEQAFVVLMTMGHTTDKPILLALLKHQEQTQKIRPYIGVIGSKAKAVQLKKDIVAAGLSEAAQSQFYCPMGLELGNNQPAEIAVSIAAQLVQERDNYLNLKRENLEKEPYHG